MRKSLVHELSDILNEPVESIDNEEGAKIVWNAAIQKCMDLLHEERRISMYYKEFLIHKMEEAKK